jgi:hypothetical protein
VHIKSNSRFCEATPLHYAHVRWSTIAKSEMAERAASLRKLQTHRNGVASRFENVIVASATAARSTLEKVYAAFERLGASCSPPTVSLSK